jgi:hypothetical protein
MDKPPPALMIAILPHAHGGEPDEDNLDRERGGDGGGNSLAHRIIRSLVKSLNHGGPMAARQVKLYGNALCNMADSHVHQDEHGFDEACDEALDALHEIIEGHKRGPK